MQDELTFYTHPMSRGRIVRWMLEEVGAPYRTEVVAYGAEMKSAPYVRLNPMGKVPTLVHGDAVITEVAAICTYLADAFPDARLGPDVASRADYYRWMFFLAGPFEAALYSLFLERPLPSDKEPMLGYGRLDVTVDTLAWAVSRHEFIAGSRFTAADVLAGAMIGWHLDIGTIDKRPEFVDYAARMRGRAAARKAEALDDALQG